MPLLSDPEKQPVLIYDGNCKLCTDIVNRIKRLTGKDQILFITGQSQQGQQFLKQHHLEDFQSVVFLEGKIVHTHSDAVFSIMQKLKTPWNWLSVFRILPRRLTDAVYNYVARNRTCQVNN